MKITPVAKIKGDRQDGAIFGGFMFSFNAYGKCTVYKTESLRNASSGEAEIFAEFVLDKCDVVVPHSNSVAFGSEYYDPNDEFPLLYTNVYNNCSEQDDKQRGVCLVYRLTRSENKFSSRLVQAIRVGFTEDEALWRSRTDDARPYGNFAVDTQNGVLYAFTMRDGQHTTRYFAFALPKLTDGEYSTKYGVNCVSLEKSDIQNRFDCEYHKFIQGACCHDGKIYSLEGFTANAENPPAIRVIDTVLGKQTEMTEFSDLGSQIEPEAIDFDGETCYYSDHNGNLYELSL